MSSLNTEAGKNNAIQNRFIKTSGLSYARKPYHKTSAIDDIDPQTKAELLLEVEKRSKENFRRSSVPARPSKKSPPTKKAKKKSPIDPATAFSENFRRKLDEALKPYRPDYLPKPQPYEPSLPPPSTASTSSSSSSSTSSSSSSGPKLAVSSLLEKMTEVDDSCNL